MECFAVFMIVIITIVVLTGITSRLQSRANRRTKAFQMLAHRYGGVCTSGGWFRYPSIRFRYGEPYVVMRCYHRRGKGIVTQVTVDWPFASDSIAVVNRNGPLQRSFRSAVEVTVGEPRFDQPIVVRARDPDRTRRLLSQGVQWQVLQLAGLLDRAPFLIVIHHQKMTIDKMARVRQYADLESFLQTALGVYDQAMLTVTQGIDFVEDGTAQIIREASCPVCAEEIIEDMVFCCSCRTPHHHECWQYNGACAVYACRETRFAVPYLARPQDAPSTSD